MYATCPKCGHSRAESEPDAGEVCPACGLIYAKWLRSQLGAAAPVPVEPAREAGGTLARRILGRLLEVEPRVNPFVLGGRAAVWLGLLVWSFWFFGTDYRAVGFGTVDVFESFMHRVDLVFHEAGHVLFMPFGEFMMVLGGSVGQLLMPLIVCVVFVVRQHNPFGASVGLWWLGQSAMDLAPYVADARAGRLILLGGFTGRDRPGFHDWERLLGWLGWLEHDVRLGGLVHATGLVLMGAALGWGGWLLRAQYRNLDRRF